jgi:hypothetical protein
MSNPYRDATPERLTRLQGADAWVVVAEVIAVVVRGKDTIAILFRNGREQQWTTSEPAALASKFAESINKAGTTPSAEST